MLDTKLFFQSVSHFFNQVMFTSRHVPNCTSFEWDITGKVSCIDRVQIEPDNFDLLGYMLPFQNASTSSARQLSLDPNGYK